MSYFVVAAGILVSLLCWSCLVFTPKHNGPREPPIVGYMMPILGSVIQYSRRTMDFLQKCRDEYGDVFTLVMMGQKLTYLLGPEGSKFVYNLSPEVGSAKAAYLKLTRPVFGPGVAYDVEPAIFMDQKRLVKNSFTKQAIDGHVDTIVQETYMMFDPLIKAKKSKELEIFATISDLTTYTASHCLLGYAIRKSLDGEIYRLYRHLDLGLKPPNLFISNLPFPSFINRDKAQRKMSSIFRALIEERRKFPTTRKKDVLQTLIDSPYRNGKKMSDTEISHLMIAILLAGQHTSSATLTWLLLETARCPDVMKKIREELSMALTDVPDTPPNLLPEVTRESLEKLVYLDCALKETLRLHPPIHTSLRVALKSIEYKGYKIPKGHYVCTAIALNCLDPRSFPNPTKFDPDRFLHKSYATKEWDIDVREDFGNDENYKYTYLPFGAGRHRCIGEKFATTQIKAIYTTIIKNFDISLTKDSNGVDIFPEADYTSLVVVPKYPSRLIITPI